MILPTASTHFNPVLLDISKAGHELSSPLSGAGWGVTPRSAKCARRATHVVLGSSRLTDISALTDNAQTTLRVSDHCQTSIYSGVAAGDHVQDNNPPPPRAPRAVCGHRSNVRGFSELN